MPMDFFKKKEAEKTVFVILADLVLLFSYSLGGVSQYFAYRTYEGKAIIAYLYMTVILDSVWQYTERRRVCGHGADCFCVEQVELRSVILRCLLCHA